MDVLALLKSKNRCLERFLTLSAGFLEKAEGGDLSGLSKLEKNRGACLKAVALYDRKISEVAASLPHDEVARIAEHVRAVQAQRKAIFEKIVQTDAKIFARMTEAKDRLVEEVNRAKKSKNILRRFKSIWFAESGEGIDTKL